MERDRSKSKEIAAVKRSNALKPGYIKMKNWFMNFLNFKIDVNSQILLIA